MQPLPFSIEVKDFCIGHYANGQPKSFASDLVIHDPERGEAAGYENYMAPLAMDGRRFFSVVYGRRPANRFVTLYTRRCNGSRDVAAGILDACLTVMQTLPVDLYAELLADYGVDLTQGISARDGALFDDVVNAMGALCSYGYRPAFCWAAFSTSSRPACRLPGHPARNWWIM